MGHGGGHLPQDDQELGALSCGGVLGVRGGIPENADDKELVPSTSELRLISRANSWPSLRRPARGNAMLIGLHGHKRVRHCASGAERNRAGSSIVRGWPCTSGGA